MSTRWVETRGSCLAQVKLRRAIFGLSRAKAQPKIWGSMGLVESSRTGSVLLFFFKQADQSSHRPARAQPITQNGAQLYWASSWVGSDFFAAEPLAALADKSNCHSYSWLTLPTKDNKYHQEYWIELDDMLFIVTYRCLTFVTLRTIFQISFSTSTEKIDRILR